MNFKNLLGRYLISEPFTFQFFDAADQVKATDALMNFFENIHLQSGLTEVSQDQINDYILTNLYGFGFKTVGNFHKAFTPAMKEMAIGSFAILEGLKGNAGIVIPIYAALGWTVLYTNHIAENVVDIVLDPPPAPEDYQTPAAFTKQAGVINPWLEYYYTVAGTRLSVNGFFNTFSPCVCHIENIDLDLTFLTTILFSSVCRLRLHTISFDPHFETTIAFDASHCHIANTSFAVEWLP
jgi:hypothetical protein